MTVDTTPSTFEFARDWLVSSEAFVRDAMLATALDIDSARDEARARIHDDEVYEEPNEDVEGAHAPDLPPPVDGRPLAKVITVDDKRERNGTGSWRSSGVLHIAIEVLVPEEHQIKYDGSDDAATKSAKFKACREWARRLCKTIRNELLATSGQGDAQGNPYLNARDVSIYVAPIDLEQGEDRDIMAFEYEVPWR